MTALTEATKRMEHRYFESSPFRSGYFLIVVGLFVLAFIRAIWNVEVLWRDLDVHMRIQMLVLVGTFPAPIGVMLRYHKRLRERIVASGDEQLRRDVARTLLSITGYSYFLLFLALEVTFLLFRK
jgi:hypothetical protein